MNLLNSTFITFAVSRIFFLFWGPSWSLSYASWIYNYLCNQCLSTLTLWVWIPLRRGVLDTTLCYKVCQLLVTGWWFTTGIPVSPINKIDRHDITEILLKVALNTINQPTNMIQDYFCFLNITFTSLFVSF